jgi:hypothetical protein
MQLFFAHKQRMMESVADAQQDRKLMWISVLGRWRGSHATAPATREEPAMDAENQNGPREAGRFVVWLGD